MKVTINKDNCIGCGACVSIEPEVFEFDDEGLASVKNEEVKDDQKENVTTAKEGCPTDAIIIEQ